MKQFVAFVTGRSHHDNTLTRHVVDVLAERGGAVVRTVVGSQAEIDHMDVLIESPAQCSQEFVTTASQVLA